MESGPTKSELKSAIQMMNLFFARIEKLYHAYAVRHGLSCPALIVLLTVAERDGMMTQQALARLWSLPKQTMNYTITSLVRRGCLSLEQNRSAGNSKSIRLTDEGLAFCKAVIYPMYELEFQAFEGFSRSDLGLFVGFQKRHCESFERVVLDALK